MSCSLVTSAGPESLPRCSNLRSFYIIIAEPCLQLSAQ